jgi:hypothetical protein
LRTGDLVIINPAPGFNHVNLWDKRLFESDTIVARCWKDEFVIVLQCEDDSDYVEVLTDIGVRGWTYLDNLREANETG